MIAGRYRLLEPLGRGAMSSVWLAQDDELERRVAVKMLAESADRARFEREARAAAALSHPNICALYDYGEADGRPYMVLEYLQNGSLEERLKSGPLPDEETLRISTEMAAGLAHAHERGLVHRDLKPANVLFDAEDRAKIADFGIARMGGSGTLTEAGTVLGTASYISPEQASGQPAGPASDVYSFGVILFRMLTGRLPFVSTNAMELVRMHRDDPPPAVVDFRPDAPARLESIAAAALAKDPAERPPDGAALLRELRGQEPSDGGGAATVMLAPGALSASSDATQVVRPGRAARRRRGRSRGTLWLVPLVLALLAGGYAFARFATGGSGDAPPTTNPLPGLSLPSVPTAGSTQPTTTAPSTSTAYTTTTAPTTTTTPPTTTHRATTVPITTPTPPTVAPTTTVAPLPTTTAPAPPPLPTTTALPPPTDTLPTTTVPIPPTP
ncbi:MAG: eukaryotic-like serine/threonine-protein kinase [Gaiellaceae bacterium]|nr:eukaryotic-like serine/threonine-protein kinase [Gaiellaceae bacterium]